MPSIKATIVRRELEGVADVLVHPRFSLAARAILARERARAALLYEPHTRPQGRRLARWWDRVVRARWQTRRAR